MATGEESAKAGVVYGIKLAASEYESGKKKIEAITRFKSGNLLSGFDEITEADYNRWVELIGPFSYWDVVKESVENDAAAESESNDNAAIAAIRARLKWLYFEIQFTTELEESTTALQAEYDALLIEYNTLTA